MVWPNLSKLAVGILASTVLALPQEPDNVIVNQTLKVDVELVVVNVSVTDPQGRPVTGLTEEDFRIWEDKVEQKVEYFSSEEVPVSVGIIFDVSGSMKNKLPEARDAAETFLHSGNRDDEYFLIEFSDRPQITLGFTGDISNLQRRLSFAPAKGNTSLFDAVYLGLKKVEEGINSKKALLLITDGEDNRSRYTFANVKEFARERDVQIYSIGIMPSMTSFVYGIGAHPRIASLSEITGGSAFFPRSVHDLKDICTKIAADLKSQYVLGYRSTNQVKDGRWRTLHAKLAPTKEGESRLSVRARAGYYAAATDASSR